MRTGQKSGITNGRVEIPPLPATMQAVATPREAAREKREALLKSERWLGEDHGWAAALWLFAPTRKLDGARPADIFQANPEAVIDAARRDFEGDDADW